MWRFETGVIETVASALVHTEFLADCVDGRVVSRGYVVRDVSSHTKPKGGICRKPRKEMSVGESMTL